MLVTAFEQLSNAGSQPSCSHPKEQRAGLCPATADAGQPVLTPSVPGISLMIGAIPPVDGGSRMAINYRRHVGARAMVQLGPDKLEEREIGLPSIGDGEVLLRIEATGVCGSDQDQLNGNLARAGWASYPVVPGHEPVGRVVEIGAEARRLLRLSEGQLVAVESVVPCHVCRYCVRGLVKFCENRFSYGFTPTTVGCGLWGGFAEYMVLRPNTVAHVVPDGVPAELATLFNPLGAGFDWTIRRAETAPGDVVLVFGSGQRGLACVLAAKSVGASQILVTGLEKDRHKLDIASKLGATATINVDEVGNVADAIRIAVGGELIDRVIDTTPHATAPIADAIELIRPGGVIVVAGLKGEANLDVVKADRIVLKAIDVRGVVSVASWGYAQAMKLMAADRAPLELLHTHTVPLGELRQGIDLLKSSQAVHVSIVP